MIHTQMLMDTDGLQRVFWDLLVSMTGTLALGLYMYEINVNKVRMEPLYKCLSFYMFWNLTVEEKQIEIQSKGPGKDHC